MSRLIKLQSVVSEPMARFKELYQQTLSSETESVDRAMHYILKSQGKHMRPLLTILSAGLCSGVTERTIVSSVLIEIIHTASLVHDDIVDEAFQRRSMWSVAALWRSRSAVLLGDFVLAKGINIAISSKLYDILALAGGVIERMSEGEILQSGYALSMDIDEKGYFEIINCKTASLISIAASAGAISSGAKESEVEVMGKFGRLVGEAFQIKDDILDYTATSSLGKPLCGDIKERKITLPLIYALEKADEKERKKVLDHVRDAHSSSKSVKYVRDFVLSSGGDKMALEKMTSLKTEAIDLLSNMPDNIYKGALIDFAEYTLSRDK